jgi:hypothetical protein
MWVDFWHALTGDDVIYLPFSDGGHDAVEFIDGGARYRAAEAVFRLLSRVEGHDWMYWAYRYIPGFAWISEGIYRLIPARRNTAYWITRAFWGRHVEVPSYRVAAALFAKALAIVYLIAFVSFGLQADGLIGSHGISPVRAFLDAVPGWQYPTVFWWASSDEDLRGACWIGALLAIAAALVRPCGVLQRTAFALMFVLYLSIVTAGQVFMGYQWDYLLLEAGFLAIFLVPTLPRIWIFQWLLFRLMFESGLVKLQSHDATWHGLTALTYHYETQPLPTPLSWYAAQLPLWFQKASVVFVFGVELVLPFLMFGPRRLKQVAAAGTILLQVLILLTGNYTFFNWLTIALCLFLLDDRFFGRMSGALTFPLTRRRPNRFLSAALAVFVVVIGCTQIAEMCGSTPPVIIRRVNAWISPFGLVNEYGLFASMTTTRPEISIEGSNDAVTWLAYEFRYKAGPLDRAPAWVAPYQPRLDWQMWFAALGSYPQSPWFGELMLQLLRGSPPVLRLLERDPFAGKPPKYIRAQTYEYRFTHGHAKDWWTRELKGAYFPAVSLK